MLSDFCDCYECNPIDWKGRAIKLATVVNQHRIHRMTDDRLLAWKIAKEILEEAKANAATNAG